MCILNEQSEELELKWVNVNMIMVIFHYQCRKSNYFPRKEMKIKFMYLNLLKFFKYSHTAEITSSE